MLGAVLGLRGTMVSKTQAPASSTLCRAAGKERIALRACSQDRDLGGLAGFPKQRTFEWLSKGMNISQAVGLPLDTWKPAPCCEKAQSHEKNTCGC